MNLQDLSQYKNIAIQCHDFPDADAVCSGFALQSYFQSLGAHVSLVYGGKAAIAKPNLLILLDMLDIEIAHIQSLPPETELLVTVDCQRGAGNVQAFDLPENAAVAVIDHHRPEVPEGDTVLIRPYLASCATVVWDLLGNAGYEMDSRVKNALFYGLFSDTNGLSELRHPLDRDLAEIPSDAGMVRKLANSAITIDELGIIGAALKERETIGNIGLFRAAPCDPNLLGFTSDIAMKVVHIDCCVVYCQQPHGLKLSIRSSAREIMAHEIAAFLCRDAGSGGGNIEKAGGFLSLAKIEEISGGMAPAEYLQNRVRAYLDSYDLIYAGKNDLDFAAMPLYRKRPLPVGFVPSADVFPAGTRITVRTLEGDVDTLADGAIYLMIGIRGEVYPISRETFERAYTSSDEPFRQEAEYEPAILNRVTGEKRNILALAKTCVPKDSKLVRGSVLKRDTKVFTNWDTEKYFYGDARDYIVANEGHYDDCYIVREDIFYLTYEPYTG